MTLKLNIQQVLSKHDGLQASVDLPNVQFELKSINDLGDCDFTKTQLLTCVVDWEHEARDGLVSDYSQISHEIVIAFADGTPVGCAILAASNLPLCREVEPWITNVFVTSEYRNQGIATGMIQWLVRRAGELGMKEIWIFTERAQTLFVRLGWKYEKSAMLNGRPITMSKKSLVDWRRGPRK
jgi:N-acetylglutamate synthase-like GNAT family acetyltransferase